MSEDFTGQLKVLASYGFADQEKNMRALRKANGILTHAIDYLVANNVNEAPKLSKETKLKQIYVFPVLEPQKQQLLLHMSSMGFSDEGKMRNALDKCNWNIEQATAVLLDDCDSLDSGYSGVPLDRASRQIPIQQYSVKQQPAVENPFEQHIVPTSSTKNQLTKEQQVLAEFDPFSDSNRI